MRTPGPARRREPVAGTRPPVRLLFRAFSDPIRLRILHLLERRRICVGDLVTILGVPQATASRHLTYLRRARLVRAGKQGRFMHYSLAPSTGRLHSSLLACLGSCAREMPELAGDVRRLHALRQSGGCCPR
jgi:ArsR family transcriptional regulator